MPAGRWAALPLALAVWLLSAPSTSASEGSGHSSKKHTTVTLTVSPGGTVARDTPVVMTALVAPGAAQGVVRFYDGVRLLAQKPHVKNAPVVYSTLGLNTGLTGGPHQLRAVFGRGTPFKVVAMSRWVALFVTKVPTIDDSYLEVEIPKRTATNQLPERFGRPPHLPPPRVSGLGRGRGGLAYTGVALVGLLLLAATLIATGSAARWGGRRRARVAVRVVGGILTVVGGFGVAVVYIGGASSSRAAPPSPGQLSTLPSDPLDDRSLTPVWPSGQPAPTLSVLGPSGDLLTEPIVVAAGQELTVVASGFGADDGILAHPSDAGPASQQLRADGTGTVRFLVIIPRAVNPGLHTISLAGSRLTAGVAFTVVGRMQ